MAIIGAPSSLGGYAPGQELAPSALRAAGLVSRIEAHGVQVEDRGDLAVRRWTPDHVSPHARNVAGVLEVIDHVRTAVRDVLDAGRRAVVLGGDCTVGLGTIDAVGDAVVYLDLHADMNVPSSVPDGALDWMGLGHALDLRGAHPRLAATCTLTADDVVLLGFAPEHATDFERDSVTALGIPFVSRTELAAGPVRAARRALEALGPDRRITVHFDVDLVDFNDTPLAEHTASGQGVTFAQAVAALEAVLEDPRVAALTVTEHNPAHGAADGSDTARLAEAVAGAVAGWADAPSLSAEK